MDTVFYLPFDFFPPSNSILVFSIQLSSRLMSPVQLCSKKQNFTLVENDKYAFWANICDFLSWWNLTNTFSLLENICY